jgi:thiamine-phosphate pyrophosphorylase
MGILPFDVLVITDAIACHRADRTVLETIRYMFADGDWPRVAVLLRDKQSPLAEVEKLLQQLIPIVSKANAHLLIHSYPQLALDYGLLGVHCAAAVPLASIRATLGPQFLLGVSRHGDDPLDEQDIGLSHYATISPIFSPTSKPLDTRATLSFDGLQACLQRTVRPLVALGGIQPHHGASLIAQGAAAIAISGAILEAESPHQVLKAFWEALPRSS